MDTAGKQLDGATLVLNAWLDADFEERLLADAPSAALELGISTANANAPTVLTVVKNTPTTHNLIVCTLCSCYPIPLLGLSPSWYKSREYRARSVREPRRVLEEFGLTLETAKGIRVHDSTADHRYIVLPERPADTFGWSKEKLKSIITRDTMVGVAISTVDDSV
jgi:nitrile hydratase